MGGFITEKTASQKDGRMTDIIKGLTAEFVERESNRTSLITVTRVELIDRGREARIFVTVLPDTMAESALEFLKRMRSDLRTYVTQKSRLFRIPRFDFMLDVGEKNRQRIEEISATAEVQSDVSEVAEVADAKK